MKVFVLGLPNSGRTTVSKALSSNQTYYISAVDWLKATFRPHLKPEKLEDFQNAYYDYYVSRLTLNPYLCVDNLFDVIEANKTHPHFVIDGVMNPKDFTHLFDAKKDIVVFLNRTDNMTNGRDYEGIGVNVMRDYCLWLSTMGFLTKDRWIEYNFRIPGEESDFIKFLGAKNTVTITKSINRAIEDLKDKLWHLQSMESS